MEGDDEYPLPSSGGGRGRGGRGRRGSGPGARAGSRLVQAAAESNNDAPLRYQWPTSALQCLHQLFNIRHKKITDKETRLTHCAMDWKLFTANFNKDQQDSIQSGDVKAVSTALNRKQIKDQFDYRSKALDTRLFPNEEVIS